jgi:hypothetical protein
MEPLSIGTGLYTPAEAAALLHEKATTVRRWAFGYARNRRPGTIEHPPLIHTELPEIEGQRALTFVELVELMYVRGFQRAGAPWRLIKEAARVAARLYQTDHPFAVRTFLADPKGIYAVLSESTEQSALVELVGHGQHTLADLVKPYLGQLDFDFSDVASRWWPMGREGRVVVDPRHEFGAPIIEEVGLRTKLLSDAFYAERNGDDHEAAVRRVAWLYRVRADHVDTALRFKQWLLAA